MIGKYVATNRMTMYSSSDRTKYYNLVGTTMAYSYVDATVAFEELDTTIMYSIAELSLPIWVHTHGYFAVPAEQIDGERTDFTFQGSYMEILLNGIPQLYTKTATGISLDEAPVVGDHLWGWWTI